MRPTLISLALAALLVLAPVARPHTQAGDRDEQEAQGLAVRFMKRLHETDDFQPLVSEFFPKDFAARLRAAVRDASPEDSSFHFCAREVLLRAPDADLRRAYLALMNFWSQQERLGDAAWGRTQLEYKIARGVDTTKGDAGAWARYLRLTADSVPEEAFRIAETDPLLKTVIDFTLLTAAVAEPAAEGAEPVDEAAEAKAIYERSRAAAVRDLARLRALTEKLERCAALLRGAAAKLRAQTQSLAAAHSVNAETVEGGRRGEEFHVYKLESETLEEEAFGLPAGSVLIRARVYPYEMAVARLEGRLTILAVYPDFDGD